MRTLLSSLFLAFATVVFTACGHLDMTMQAQGDRLLEGTVNFRSEVPLPDNAVAVVRLLDVSRADMPPQVIGEQEIKGPLTSPVRFSVEYKAEDLLPPKRVNVEARISVGGKLRFCSVNSVAVTPAKAEAPFALWIEQAGR